MELRIQDLVSSIRSEGIEEAEKEKAAIVEAARAQADEIVKTAKAEAQRLSDETRRQLALEKESSIEATRQACRDVVISLKQELGGLLSSVMARKIGRTLGPQEVCAIAKAALQGEDPSRYELQTQAFEAELRGLLAEEIGKGLALRTLPGIEGFKLAEKDGSGFYDFSPEELARVVRPFIGNLDF